MVFVEEGPSLNYGLGLPDALEAALDQLFGG
jgi:hypothetical protein